MISEAKCQKEMLTTAIDEFQQEEFAEGLEDSTKLAEV